MNRDIRPNNNINRKPAVRKPNNQVVRKTSNTHIRKNASGLVAVKKPRIVTVKQKKKTPFPMATVFTCVVITGLLLIVMVYFAELNKMNTEMNEMNDRVVELKKEKDKIQTILDSRDNIASISKRAQELGMVQSRTLPREYVNLTNDDKTEIVKIEDEKGGFGFMLSGFSEVFKNFFENN